MVSWPVDRSRKSPGPLVWLGRDLARWSVKSGRLILFVLAKPCWRATYFGPLASSWPAEATSSWSQD